MQERICFISIRDKYLQRKKTSLFRQSVVAEFSSSEQTNQLIRVVPPYAWVILAGGILILVSALVWGFVGIIPTRVMGQGILLASKGSLYNATATAGGGRIAKIFVNPGQEVKKGQIIAHLDRPDLDNKIEESTKYLASLQDQYTQLKATAAQEISKRHADIDAQSQKLQQARDEANKNLAATEELMKIRQAALARGIEVKQNVLNSVHDYYSLKQSIENIDEQIISNNIAKATFDSEWKERLRALDLLIKSTQHDLNNLRAEQQSTATITSPIDGIITGFHAALGDFVAGGTAIVSIASKGQRLDALVYLSPASGKRVKVGMPAVVSPSTIKKEEFGSIKGKIIEVTQYPASKSNMMTVLQNEDLVNQFLAQGAPIAVRIMLYGNPESFSEYQWTSGEGPQQKITLGTLVETRITVREQSPISLVIPAFKQLLGE